MDLPYFFEVISTHYHVVNVIDWQIMIFFWNGNMRLDFSAYIILNDFFVTISKNNRHFWLFTIFNICNATSGLVMTCRKKVFTSEKSIDECRFPRADLSDYSQGKISLNKWCCHTFNCTAMPSIIRYATILSNFSIPCYDSINKFADFCKFICFCTHTKVYFKLCKVITYDGPELSEKKTLFVF